MAKRFTDSEKWKNPWFRTLQGPYRWLWIYILDSCDPAGVWMSDFDLASYMIGSDVTESDALSIFGDKVVKIDTDKWFIPSFISFQYGALQKDSRPHLSVIKILEKLGIDHETLTLSIQYPKGIDTLKDIDKDKEQNKDKDKEPNSTQVFEERFNPENAPFANRLGELQIKSRSIFNKIFLVRQRFETVEELDKWITGISESKGFKEKPTPYGKQQYLAACLINECGMVAS